jgi:cell wall-associated NlpC family hydrolase
MPHTIAVRPKTIGKTRRLGVALGLVTALTGGLLVAQTPQAEAVTVGTATQARPDVRIAVKNGTMVKGREATIYARASTNGHSFRGRARLVINGDVVRVKRLVNGRVQFAPSTSNYRTGANKVRVVISPASHTGLRVTSTGSRTVRLKPTGSPVVNVAKRYIGTRYVYGGSSPRGGFDCSGFTSYVYRKAIGKSLPRSSSGQKAAGRTVSRSQARPGDIIWTPGHVAIYIGNGKLIESARPGVGVVKRGIWQHNPRFIRISNAAIGA